VRALPQLASEPGLAAPLTVNEHRLRRGERARDPATLTCHSRPVPDDDLWTWGETRTTVERQAQKAAVDAAERLPKMFGPEDDGIQADHVEEFLIRVLAESEFELPPPGVELDLDRPEVLAELLEKGPSDVLAGDMRLAGLTKEGVIHLDPRRLNQWNALHELAHYVAPRASHGPIWCRVFIVLLEQEFGAGAGDEFESDLRLSGALVADTLD
jgi:hypothetical protein